MQTCTTPPRSAFEKIFHLRNFCTDNTLLTMKATAYIPFKKSLIIHEQNTKEIIAVEESFIDKTHVDFQKTFGSFASIFSAYTTSTLKILS